MFHDNVTSEFQKSGEDNTKAVWTPLTLIPQRLHFIDAERGLKEKEGNSTFRNGHCLTSFCGGVLLAR